MSLSNPKSWLLYCSLLTLSGLVLQFFLFRIPQVYNLNLQTRLYDHVWWVDHPAKHIILGSSNAMNAIMPEVMAEVTGRPIHDFLNLGMNGATPFFMHRNLELYLSRFPAPERIDLVLTPIMLQEELYAKCEYEKIWLSHSQWQQLQREQNIVNSYFFPAMLFWESLEFKQSHLFHEYHFNLNSTRKSRGFQPNYDNPYHGDLRENDIPYLKENLGWAEQQIQYLKKIKEICTTHNIELYFVLTPLYKKLHDHYLLHQDWFTPLEASLDRHLGQVKILGSTNPTQYKLNSHHYINPDHLSLSGAKIFTKALYQNESEHKDSPAKKIERLHFIN